MPEASFLHVAMAATVLQLSWHPVLATPNMPVFVHFRVACKGCGGAHAGLG